MKYALILLFLLSLVCPTTAKADVFDFKPAIKEGEISMDDLVAMLDLSIYKYQLLLKEGSKVKVVFQNFHDGRTLFSHEIDITENKVYTMKLSFDNFEGYPGDALSKRNEKLNYSLNWDYTQVFSGTRSNPLYGLPSTYIQRQTFEFGETLDDKKALLEFYSYDEKADKDELVAGIYLEVLAGK